MKKISVKMRILLFCLVSVTGVIAAITIRSYNGDREIKTPGISVTPNISDIKFDFC